MEVMIGMALGFSSLMKSKSQMAHASASTLPYILKPSFYPRSERRKHKSISFLPSVQQRAATAMAEADWSSLPSDLVNRIADCLLASNDVDCYMDFRAVCTNWRSATNDPKNSADLRFRPRRWIVIDEVFQSDARLLVNTVSGRIVRKELPLLRGFYYVATHGGFFVLAEKKPPHAACVLNPLTGHMIRFVAPMIWEEEVSAYVVGSSPTLILLSHRTGVRYWGGGSA
ncbi:hypothetical protein ZWY2020_028731 [Hordeum vulgare]|nr:hypothetical protein ZWY2020_028731 [Hordeum vulgare]